MIAILRHEVHLLFSGFTAYVYGLFSLLAVAIYMMYYNLSMGYANFEYALMGASFAFLITVPVITMRVISEEKKQKTDQLLYSLPVSATQIVAGKYLALLITSSQRSDGISSDSPELRESVSPHRVWHSAGIYYAGGFAAGHRDFYLLRHGISGNGGRDLLWGDDSELLYGDPGGVCNVVGIRFPCGAAGHRADSCLSDPAYDSQ